MPLTYAQIVEITRDKAKQDLLDLLDAAGFTGTSWQEGSVTLANVELGAEIWSKLTSSAVFLKELGLNETSTGDGLTRFSRSHYANERTAPIAAQRNITLACSATEGPHSIGLGSVVLSDATGKTFRNIDGLGIVYPFTLASGSSQTFLFEAEVAGAASTLAENAVTKLITTLAGVTVIGDVPTKTGVDQEGDPKLQVRNSTKWSLLTEFELIKDAVINIALSAAPAIAQAAVDDQNPRGAGTFDVYIAREVGVFDLASSEIATLQTELNKRVFGVATALAKRAGPSTLDVAGTIYYDSTLGLSTDQVKTAVETVAIPDFIKSIPIGGFNFGPDGPAHIVAKNDLESAIKVATVNGLPAVKTLVLTTPTADTAIPSFDKVALGTMSLIYTAVTSS